MNGVQESELDPLTRQFDADYALARPFKQGEGCCKL